ncbi:hypothetical protein [Cobetia amphilecti]|uniref:Uncharacterized protein n=1 Tax=Cobetia amphilecti TaxID=1055104 RepID=A0AAP4TY95_9GAMM|nr:hypothetical protein [Cobetia amphilecti]MDO6670503.1 hypothetical protein [Cobetia amphilecti]
MSQEKEINLRAVKYTRTIYEHNFLEAIAINQLENAKSEKEGYRFRWIIPSMAFSVFRVEALCNIYGSQLFQHWKHFESMSLIGKVTMISEFLEIKVDFSEEPWQSLATMVKFRNTLVHAKPRKASKNYNIDKKFIHILPQFPDSDKTIMSFSSISNAEKFEKSATNLEMLWLSYTSNSKYKVDTIGRPKVSE